MQNEQNILKLYYKIEDNRKINVIFDWGSWAYVEAENATGKIFSLITTIKNMLFKRNI